MLSPHEAQSYEQQSIRRTLCAGCTKELTPEETYACAECVDEWLVPPNNLMDKAARH